MADVIGLGFEVEKREHRPCTWRTGNGMEVDKKANSWPNAAGLGVGI
jgi:hypothetical protein